jgi:hypothetical protein
MVTKRLLNLKPIHFKVTSGEAVLVCRGKDGKRTYRLIKGDVLSIDRQLTIIDEGIS